MKAPRRDFRPFAKKWAKRLGVVFAVLVPAGGIATWAVVRHYSAGLPTIEDLRAFRPAQVTRVLARDGTVLAELFRERRTVVPIAKVPDHVKLAFLAAEDAGFFEHHGLNPLGMLRAIAIDIRSGHGRQGGSTITQQLVRNVSLGFEHTLARKIREALLALRIETALSKEEIFELYINQVNFGRGRFGIEEAARDAFGKGAKDLTIAEAAMLAGVLPSPEHYNPHANLDHALARRRFVLGQMHKKGFLNDAQFQAASDEPVRLAPEALPSSDVAPEAVEIARNLLKELAPEASKLGGFTITTTIDPKLQLLARRALREAIGGYDARHGLFGLKAPPPPPKNGKTPKPSASDPALFEGTPTSKNHGVLVGSVLSADDAAGTFDVQVGTIVGTVKLADYERYNPKKLGASLFAPIGAHVRVTLLGPVPETTPDQKVTVKVPLRLESGPEGAFVAIDVRTRDVLALVGQYETREGGLDRATQSKRQPGSSFKPIVYSYALHSRKFTPATLVNVNPEVFEGGYKPSNFEGWQGKDPLRLREVLANSVNVGAVRVLQSVGPANVVAWAQGLGITTPLKPDLSLALGSYEVRPIELAGAYATFASGGMYEQPRIVSRIVGPDGKELPLKAPPTPHRALEETEAYEITNMLTSVVDHGTAVRVKQLARPIAGKTGTTNQAKDTWFAGYSPDLTAVVWIGYDDAKPLGGNEQGAVTALPAFMTFMKGAEEGRAPSDFPEPPGIVHRLIDAKTGKLAYDGDPSTLDEVFLAGTEPTEVATPEDETDDGDAGHTETKSR